VQYWFVGITVAFMHNNCFTWIRLLVLKTTVSETKKLINERIHNPEDELSIEQIQEEIQKQANQREKHGDDDILKVEWSSYI